MANTEFLCNIKSIPDEKSVEYNAFWDNERHKAEYGVTISGVKIHPWLYWHTQLWSIIDDIIDPISGMERRIKTKASFRDNEWLISEALTDSEINRKGIMFFGSRRLGKSEFASSFIGQGATLYPDSENVVMGGNWGDIDVIMNKIDLGLKHLNEYFRMGRLSNNLRKEIELGYKDKKGTRYGWSKIICRNHDNGLNTESPAGLTPTRFIMDEIGKSPFSAVFDAAKPSFTSKFGWRCLPILTGTSGDILKNSDAQRFFEHPESQNFLVRELIEENNKKVSVFISGLYRMEGKEETTLAKLIESEKHIIIPSDSELHTIPAQIRNEEKARAIINESRAQAEKSPEANSLIKEKMYYPLNTQELFLTDDGNNFPIDALKEHLAFLELDPPGEAVRLYRDVDGKVKSSTNTTKRAIIDFPLKDFANVKKDSAVIIYEYPEENPPAYLYISGADPYAQSNSKWSSSLGSIYIFKRVYDVVGGTYQRRIVAEYTGRPENIKDFHEICEMLLEYYNAICLPENETGTFTQYFDLLNKAYLLADTYSFLKEISPTTSIVNRVKGLPATPKVQSTYKEYIYNYLTEKITVGAKNTGEFINKLGLVRIPSIGLIKELIAWDKDGNYDRYVAFGHTLAHEVWADKIYPLIIPPIKEVQKETQKEEVKVTSPFGYFTESNPFGGMSNPFGL